MRDCGRSLAAEDALIEHAGLGEVGDLRRAADDERVREQKILKDGTQQRRGRDALGLGVEDADEIGGGVALGACLPKAVGLGGAWCGALEGGARAGLLRR